MICQQVMEILIDYVEGDLSEDLTKDLEEHLVDCEACHNFINTYKTSIKITRTIKEEDMPEELKKRLKDFISDRLKA